MKILIDRIVGSRKLIDILVINQLNPRPYHIHILCAVFDIGCAALADVIFHGDTLPREWTDIP
jgi:hypothetical protein